MSTATQRYLSHSEGEGNKDKTKNIFNVSIVLHIVVALMVVLLMEVIGYIIFNDILNIPGERKEAAILIYHFMVATTFFTIISVPYDAVINAHENMKLFALLGVLEAILKLLIAIYITSINSDKLVMYGLLMAVTSILLLIIRRIYCIRTYEECKIDLKEYFDNKIFKEMLKFAMWSFLGASSSMLALYGQGMILNIFFGTVVNAAQGVSNQISGQLSAVSSTLLKALNPLIVKSEGAGNRLLMIKASITGTKLSFILLLIFYVPIFIEMEYIFNLWLDIVPEYTIIFCRLLLIRNLIEQLFATLPSLISAVGNIHRYQMMTSVLYLIPLPISYLAFKIGFQPYIMYIIFIIYSMFAAMTNLYYAKLFCGLKINTFNKEVVYRCNLLMLLSSILPLYINKTLEPGFIRITIVIVTSLSCISIIGWKICLSDLEKSKAKELINDISNKLYNIIFNFKVAVNNHNK